MKIFIISHSYLEPENHKNIKALSAAADVQCVLPDRGKTWISSNYRFQADQESSGLFCSLGSIKFSQSQYLFRSLASVLRRNQPEIINVEYNPWSLVFIQAAILRSRICPRAKLVCTVKKNTYRKDGLTGYLKDRFARNTVNKVDHYIAASAMVRQLLETKFSIPSNEISVCHHMGVDVDLFKPTEEETDDQDRPIVIGYCGRLEEKKGVKDLLVAAHKARQLCSRPVLLKLLGPVGYSKTLDSALASAQAEYAWLEILPPVRTAEVATFMRRLDIFVLPSRVIRDHQEHDAHVLLEALSAGVSTIGTRSGIIPEILGDGSGCVVDPAKPNELAATLSRLISDDKHRRTLAMRGREKAVKEFALDVIAQRKIEIFGKALNAKPA